MIQLVKVEDHLCAANMVAQHGYVSRANPVAIRYDALAQCLSKLAGQIEEGTLIMSRDNEDCSAPASDLRRGVFVVNPQLPRCPL